MGSRQMNFEQSHIEGIAKVLGDTNDGLSGSEIGRILKGVGIQDIDSGNTKWKRLCNALVNHKDPSYNHIVKFIEDAMALARYTENPDKFFSLQRKINKVLSLCGLTVKDDGKISQVTQAKTINDAIKRANDFKTKLEERNVHQDILQCCMNEIRDENYFHTVFEAMKSITVKIRNIDSSNHLNLFEGQELVNKAFASRENKDPHPLIAINSLNSETLRGEQRGFINLLKGLYGTIRNPLAHEPRKDWEMREQDALDIMSTISLVHRKLDRAKEYLYLV